MALRGGESKQSRELAEEQWSWKRAEEGGPAWSFGGKDINTRIGESLSSLLESPIGISWHWRGCISALLPRHRDPLRNRIFTHLHAARYRR